MEGEGSPGRASPETNEPGTPLLLEPTELPPVFKRCRTPTGEWREPGPVGDASSPLATAAEGGEVSRGAEERLEGALAQPPGDDRSLDGRPGPEASDPHHLESADLSAPDPGMELELPLGLPPASRGNVPVDRPRDQDEEPGISLASALKELHRLLVVSAKHDFRSRQEESRPSLEAPPEGPAAADEASSSREQARQGPALSCPTATEMLEEPRLDGGQQRVSGCGDSVPASHLAVWPLPQAEECPGILAQRLSSGQLPSCAAAEPSSLASLGPESRSGCSPSPKEGGASSISPEAEAKQQQQQHLEQLPEPLSFPRASESRAPPALAANLDQIVGAGFTPQEAGEALEHAGGNADLALLILLARNIVVPT